MTDLASSLVEGVTKGSVDVLKEWTRGLASGVMSIGKNEVARLSVDFETCFRNYLDRNAKRLCKIKTLLRPNSPTLIASTFISPTLKISDKLVSEDKFLASVERDRYFSIKGIGGSGKSVLLKHLFLRYYNEPLGRVPFFIELRDVPQESGGLKAHLLTQLSSLNDAVDTTLFEYALKQGKFIFLFDGFDEVNPNYQVSLAEQVKDLIYQYSDNAVVISSRPDNILDSLTEVHGALIQPFSKHQVLALLSKLKYDRSIKAEFRRIVDEYLFETHASYLSNPLLCTIMLMTFTRGAEIPSKLHLFFQKAYDVLSYQHDSMKGIVYRRKYHTLLAEDDFKEIFAAFSFITYMSSGSSFKESAGIECAKRALTFTQRKAGARDLLEDLCVSISILVKEGDNYNYIHRSFQEYFAALFLSKQRFDGWSEVIEGVLRERSNDSVPRLILEMDQPRFEVEFLAPRITQVCAELAKVDIPKQPAFAFKLFYLSFSASRNKLTSFLVGSSDLKPPRWTYMTNVLQFYPQYFKGYIHADESFDWISHLASHGRDLKVQDDEVDMLEPDDISDAMLRDTPMIKYLQDIKNALNLIAVEINTESKTRQILLTDITSRLLINRYKG